MDNCVYLVEGDTEEKIIKVLKNKYIISGKVYKIHQKLISDTLLRIIPTSGKPVVAYVFDTDVADVFVSIVKNIQILQNKRRDIELVLIPQIKNLEDELIFSAFIKTIKELLNTKSDSDFKSMFLKLTETSCLKKLEEKNFDINKFWSRYADDEPELSQYENNSESIKIKKHH